MNKVTALFCIVFTLPVIVAIGHDLFLVYMDTTAGIPVSFSLSEIGWIWQNYSIESLDRAKDSIDKETWTSIVDPILGQKALVIAAIITFVAYIIVALIHVFKILNSNKGKKNSEKGQEQNFAFNVDDMKKNDIKNKGKGSVDYKRKKG